MGAGVRLGGIVFVAALLASACAGGDEPSGATVPTPPTTTTTVAVQTIDITVIPDEITPEYLDAVFEALNALLAEALAHAIEINDIDRVVVERHRAAYASDAYEAALSSLARQREEGFPRHRSDPGAVVSKVRRVAHVERDCVVAEVEQDTSAVLADNQAEPLLLQFALIVEPREGPEFDDIRDLNPTPWVIGFVTSPDGSDPEGLCGLQRES